MVGFGMRLRLFLFFGSPVWLFCWELVETTGVWPQGLLDAYIAMIPKADGDSPRLVRGPPSVLPVVYRLWASTWAWSSAGMGFRGGLPQSVFSLGNGLSCLLGLGSPLLWTLRRFCPVLVGDQLHVMIADVIKSFDTVDRPILDCALGRLGLPGWFRRFYLLFLPQSCSSQV